MQHKKLQFAQNFAARIVLSLKKVWSHFTGNKSLSWLPVSDKVYLNNAVMIFNCTWIINLVPNYLAEKFSWPSQICMGSTRQSSQLNISRCHGAVGQRSFSYPGAKLWNGMSDTVKSTDSVNIFTVKRRKPWMAENFQESWLCSDQSQWSSGYVSKPQNHKQTILVVCGLGFSRLTGFLFATQKHSMNISGVNGFVSFTVKGDL